MSEEKIVKIKNKFRPDSISYRVKNVLSYFRIPINLFLFYFDYLKEKENLITPFLPHKIDEKFFGINVASNPDERMDDYFIERLRELNIKTVRTDYSPASNKENTERWLNRLINEGFDVLLHLVQPQNEAANMDKCSGSIYRTCVKRWETFLDTILSKYCKQIKLYEIGSTPNRQSWSGYTISDYVESVKIASGLAKKYDVKTLGPNISDFAPYFLITILRILHNENIHFDMVTDNLFVDRAGQPEEYDKHIVGEKFKNLFRLNLLKKSQVINNISKIYKCENPICTYTYWTLDTEGRKRRRYVTEGKYADYLVRYHLIVAASGLLRRVYWGQMAGYYKGIIKENVKFRCYPPTVYQKLENLGDADEYETRIGFYAYKFLIQTISGSAFKRVIPHPHHSLPPLKGRVREGGIEPGSYKTHIYEFEKNGKQIFAMWTRDGETDKLSKYLNLNLSDYDVFDRDGNKKEVKGDVVITESPCYIIQK